MDIILFLAIGGALVFLARKVGLPIGEAFAPPPAPALRSADYADSFASGTSVGISGPDASAYGPNAAAAAAAAPPTGSPIFPAILRALDQTGVPQSTASAIAAMGGVTWRSSTQPPAPIPGTVSAPPPVAPGPTTETRTGKGHF